MSNNIDNFENNNSLIKPKSKISKLGYKPINFDSHNDKAKHKKKISKDSIRDKKSGIIINIMIMVCRFNLKSIKIKNQKYL